jgi:hypothetical protein
VEMCGTWSTARLEWHTRRLANRLECCSLPQTFRSAVRPASMGVARLITSLDMKRFRSCVAGAARTWAASGKPQSPRR